MHELVPLRPTDVPDLYDFLSRADLTLSGLDAPTVPRGRLPHLEEPRSFALHVPEQYGGAGADRLAHSIVVEEIARVSASSSLIVAGNKLGTMGLILSGSEELKRELLPAVAARAAAFSYALSEREAGSDAAAMRTRAVHDGDAYVMNGTKCWITGAGVSTHYTVMAVTDPEKGANGISSLLVRADDPGFSVGTKERKLGIKGSPTCEVYFEDCRIPASHMISAEGTGFQDGAEDPGRTRSMIGAHGRDRPGRARRGAALQQGAPAVRQAHRRLPGRAVHARRHGDGGGGRAPAGLRRGRERRARPNLTFLSSASKTFASDTAMKITTDAVQLFGGYGYTKDFHVGRRMRDAKITQIYEGTNQIQRMVIARTLLT